MRTQKKETDDFAFKIPALEALPNGWAIRKLKYVADVRLSNVDKKTLEGQTPVRLCNYVDVYKNNTINSSIEFMEATATTSQTKTFELHKDDVLITKDSEDWRDIAVPAYVEEDLPGVLCGYHLAHIRPHNEIIDGNYLARCFAAEGLADQFRVSANGITRYGIGKDSIADALIPLPPLQLQKKIARFIDRKTALIDTLITKKERQIELLNEKRQALIDHLIDSVKSEVVCEQKRLKLVSHYITSGSRGWAQYYSDSGAIFLRIGNINRNSIDLKLMDIQFVEPPKGSEGERTKVQTGDLLVSITAFIGAIGIVPPNLEEAYVNQHLALVRLAKSKVNPRWIAYFLFSALGKKQFAQLTQGGTKEGLGLDDVRNLVVCIPTMKTQDKIVDQIDSETHAMNSIVEKIQAQCHRLREYRTNLISAAITGKKPIDEYLNL